MVPRLVAASLLLVASGAGAAPLCGPAVRLGGDPAVLPAVAQVLRERGVALGPGPDQPGCPALHARVERRGGRLLVVIEGPQGRRSERVVSDAGTAAALVESFTREDLSLPLLNTRSVIVPGAAAPAPGPRRFSLAVQAEGALGTGTLAWAGGSLRACAHLGPTCVGLIGRAAAVLPQPVAETLPVLQVSADLLAALSLPFVLRRVTLAPAVGLGVGFLHSELQTMDGPLSTDDAGLRAELSLTAGVPLGRGVSLDVSLALCAAYPPGGGRTVILPDADRVGGGAMTEAVPIPTPSWGTLRLGAGVAWGWPAP